MEACDEIDNPEEYLCNRLAASLAGASFAEAANSRPEGRQLR